MNRIINHVETIIISLDCDYNYNPRPHQKEIFQKLKTLSPNIKSKIKVKISLNSFNMNAFESTIKNLLVIGITQLSINIVHNITSSHHNFELSNTDIIKIFEIIEKYIDFFDKNYIKHLKDFYIDKKNNIKCQANSSFAFYNCEGIRFPCPSNYENNFDCVTKESISLVERRYYR